LRKEDEGQHVQSLPHQRPDPTQLAGAPSATASSSDRFVTTGATQTAASHSQAVSPPAPVLCSPEEEDELDFLLGLSTGYPTTGVMRTDTVETVSTANDSAVAVAEVAPPNSVVVGKNSFAREILTDRDGTVRRFNAKAVAAVCQPAASPHESLPAVAAKKVVHEQAEGDREDPTDSGSDLEGWLDSVL